MAKSKQGPYANARYAQNYQYGPNYRMPAMGQQPNVNRPTPNMPNMGNPVQQVNQIQQNRQAQQGMQPGGSNYEAMAQAIAAREAQGQSQHFGRTARGAFRNPDRGKAALTGGLNAMLRDRQGGKATDALKASALAESNAKTQKQDEVYQATRDYLVANGVPPDQADAGARMLALNPQADLSKLVPEPENRFDDETKLRQEYLKQTADFAKQTDSYGRVKASADNASPAGDLALIFNYMKILDPNSVVRESEFATAASTGSFGDRLQAAGAMLLEGKRLSDDMRKDFVDRAGALYTSAKEINGERRVQYRELAKRLDFDPDRILTERVELDVPEIMESAESEQREENKLPPIPDGYKLVKGPDGQPRLVPE